MKQLKQLVGAASGVGSCFMGVNLSPKPFYQMFCDKILLTKNLEKWYFLINRHSGRVGLFYFLKQIVGTDGLISTSALHIYVFVDETLMLSHQRSTDTAFIIENLQDL